MHQPSTGSRHAAMLGFLARAKILERDMRPILNTARSQNGKTVKRLINATTDRISCVCHGWATGSVTTVVSSVPKNRLTIGAMMIDVYANSGVAQYPATLVCVTNWRLAYKAKHWKNTYTVRYHPRKLVRGTPKYPPPLCHTQLPVIVDIVGSIVRSQDTIMKVAIAGVTK